MIDRMWLNRRNALRFGLGTVAGVCCSAFANRTDQNDQIQAFNDVVSNLAVFEPDRSLKQRAARKNLLYGATSGYRILSSDLEFATCFVEECGILVPENDLKWKALRPTPDQFDFASADWLLNFTQTNNLQIRGHTLVWHLVLPDWFEETVNYQNAERLLVNHIQTVAGRYRGKMHSWDVVNEAIEVSDGRSDQLRKTPWLEFLGGDYIDLAFRVAAEADPHARLVYNDYGFEYDRPEDESRRRAVLRLLERLKAQGTPIHAFGMQAHLEGHETRFNSAKLEAFLNDIASLGLEIMITELDVKDTYLPADITVRDRAVAAAYESYLSVALDQPTVTTVLTWGLSDRYTWFSRFGPRSDGLPVRPLPLDENLNRKMAWRAIAHTFDSAPLHSDRPH